MATRASLKVNLETNVAQFTKDMEKMSRSVDRMQRDISGALGKVQTAFGAIAAIGAGAGLFGKMISESAAAADAVAKVEQVIKSTGGVAGVTADEVKRLSTELQKQTGVSDDALNAAQGLMLTFTNVSKQVFPDAIKVVNDMSAALGQDLKSSTIQLGKALNDPIKGVSALQRVGVSLTESQTAMIKSLVKSGDTLRAQKIILEELQTEFGGAAAAARNTLGGALDALKNTVDDLFQAFGDSQSSGLRYAVEATNIAVEELIKSVEDVQKWFNSSKQSVNEFRAGLDTVLGVASHLWESFKLGINLLIEFGKTIIDQVVEPGIKAIGKLYDAFIGFYTATVPRLKEGLTVLSTFMSTFLKEASQDLPASIKTANKNMEAAGKDYVGSFIKPIFGGLDSLDGKVKERMEKIQKAANNFKAKGPKAANNFKAKGPKASEGVSVETKEEEKARKKLEKQIESEKKAVQGVVDAARERVRTLEAQIDKSEEGLALSREIEKINKNVHLTEQQRLAAVKQVVSEHGRELQLKSIIKNLDEEKKLKEVLEDMKEKNALIEAELSGNTKLVEQLKLENKIRGISKDISEENLYVVEAINKEQEKLNKLNDEKKRKEELKQVQEIAKGYKDQIESIKAKMGGYEDYLPLLREEQKILEMKNLSESDKGKAIQEVRQLHETTRMYNKTLENQEKVVSDILGNSKGYYNQVQDLGLALKQGVITNNQYETAMDKISKGTKEASEAGKQFGNIVGGALEDIALNGKSVTEVFKNMGKELIVLAAKKAIFDPLKERLGGFFDKVGRDLFGLGSSFPRTSNQPDQVAKGPGGYNVADFASRVPSYGRSPGFGGGGQNNNTGSIYNTGPVYINGASVSMPAANVGGLDSGGGLLSGLTKTLNSMFSGLFSGLNSLLGGLGSGLSGVLSGLGGMNFGGFSLGGLFGGVKNFFSTVNSAGSGGNLFGGLGSALGGLGGLFNIPKAIKGIFSPLQGFATGGFLGAGQIGIAGENGPELIFGGGSGSTIIPSNLSSLIAQMMATGNNIFGIQNFGNMDSRMLTGAFHGTPAYQFGGAPVQQKPEVQRVMDKVARWNALSPELQLARSGNPDWFVSNQEKIEALGASRTMTWDQQQATKNLMYNQNRARADALIANSAPGSLNSRLGYDILSNNTFTQLSLLDPNSRVGLPEGNQLGRIFLSAAHRGVMPGSNLMNFANQADAFADWWNPSGQWNMWFSGSGSREGMGGVGSGSYFRGNSGYVFTGDANESWYSPTGTAGVYYNGSGRLHGPALPPGWKTGPNGKAIPPSTGRTPSRVPGGYSGIGGPASGLLGRQPFGGGSSSWGIPGSLEDLFRLVGSASYGSPGYSESPTGYTTGNWTIDPKTGRATFNSRPYMPVSSGEYINNLRSQSSYFDGFYGGGERNRFANPLSALGNFGSSLWNGLFGPKPSNIPGMTGASVPYQQMLNTGLASGLAYGASMYQNMVFPSSYPRRQHGGDVVPMQSYRVNERGEEIFMSGTRGQIISRQTAEQTLAKAAGYGGTGAPPVVNVINNTSGVVDGNVDVRPDGSMTVILNEFKRSRQRRIVPR